jgi:hypothetical protein
MKLVHNSISETGYLQNTVDPEKFSAPAVPPVYSPEGQSFVLLLEAAAAAWQ